MSLQALADLRAFNRTAPTHSAFSRLFEPVNEPGRAVVVACALEQMGHALTLKSFRLAYTQGQKTLRHVVWALVLPTSKAPMWIGLEGVVGMHEIIRAAQPPGEVSPTPPTPDDWDEVEDLLDLAHQLSNLQLSSNPAAPEPLQLDALVEHAVSIMQGARLDQDTQQETSHAAPRRL